MVGEVDNMAKKRKREVSQRMCVACRKRPVWYYKNNPGTYTVNVATTRSGKRTAEADIGNSDDGERQSIFTLMYGNTELEVSWTAKWGDEACERREPGTSEIQLQKPA